MFSFVLGVNKLQAFLVIPSYLDTDLKHGVANW